MSEKIKILYIDDEPDNLTGFKANFRTEYRVFIAENTVQALEHLRKNADIRVIFCDQRMPGKTGVEFFEEIRTIFPHPIRILITAYTDIEATISAINRGNIFRYIRKPWIQQDIISAIEEGNKFYIANSMLAIKNEELQQAYTELDKFAYSVSHDLRGPLTGILGAIDVAKEMSDIKELKELLVLMEKSVFKLEDYISSMHDYYSSRRGELKIVDIDFNQVADELKDVYRIYTTTNKICFEATVHQPESFRSDEMVIKMVLNNLITNAIKYQKKNFENKKIELNISVYDGLATILISDTGIGIPESHFDEIFNLFSRATSHRAGSGIGLYNVKGGLLKLGGSIDVNSVLGEGTVFKLIIPSK
ncbi:MAG: hybrid sensor histidine kinase/response regulator [Bacteroidetes bacterium]|jgi:signal transduction histidine kinase|nr:hybrid sensor histidine kinase/response regulator [Bacteroidota bacterium]